jgi:pyridoxamine 5'-phosphate oxidase
VTALPPEALSLLTAWLPDDDEPVRPTMQVATLTEDGAPDARTVLLSAWDEEGFLFHTDARSRKVAHLAADPRVALVLLLHSGTRQLTVTGRAVPTAAAVDALAYERRSRYLQQLAWVNTAELAQRPRDERTAAWAAFAADHPGDLEPPTTWVGHLVRPERLTFWQADPEAPSHRVEHRLAEGVWSEHHLPG